MRKLINSIIATVFMCSAVAFAADVRIDQLPSAGALVGNELVPVIKADGTFANTTTANLTALTGLKNRGAWNSSTPYSINDFVSLSGSTYVALVANVNQTPPNATYWTVLAAQGAAGAAGTNGTNGTGSGTVTSIVAGSGLSGGTITTSGTLALSAIANNTVLGNVSGSSAVPIALTGTQITTLIPANGLALSQFPAIATATLIGSVAGGTPAALTGTQVGGLLGSNSVTRAALAQAGATTMLGNSGGSTANVADLSVSTVTAMLNAMSGDTGSGGAKGLVPAPAAGDAAAAKFLKADGTWTAPSVASSPYPKGYLFPRGLLAYASSTTLTIAAGVARSTDDTTNLVWSSTLTLNIASTGANALDVSGSRAASGTVHVFVIYNASGPTYAAFGSSSLVPSLPSGYTKIRRVGSIKLNASTNVIPFNMREDFVSYQTPFVDVSAVQIFSATNQTLSVPAGIYVEALIKPYTTGTVTPTNYRFFDPADADATVTAVLQNWTNENTAPLLNKSIMLRIGTNTSSQVRITPDTGVGDALNIAIFGYYDRRDQ